MRRLSIVEAVLVAALVAPAAPVGAQQALPSWGRMTIYFQNGAMADRVGTPDEESVSIREITSSFTWRSREAEEGGAEFAIDARGAAYLDSEGRRNRASVYDGYVGYRLKGGSLAIRGGQMWINDLGGLGAVAGGLVEMRRKQPFAIGRLRVGAFGGLEPSILELDYIQGVRKAGGYVAIESGSRRHVLGYVNVRNSGVTERSVISTTNFLPLKRRFFAYQAMEYDLEGVGGNGGSRLSYFMTNARYQVSKFLELQSNYHRGRSVDTRGLALDVLQGRPISTERVRGLLFETVGGRAWVTLAPGVRVNVGYSRDRTDRESDHTNRYQLGANAWNIAHSGIDFTFSRASYSGASRSYTAWDVSAGRPIGSRVYLTGDFSTNLSTVRLTNFTGDFIVEHRPRTRRYGLSALTNLNRTYSILVSADRTDDGDLKEHRELVGLTIRF